MISHDTPSYPIISNNHMHMFPFDFPDILQYLPAPFTSLTTCCVPRWAGDGTSSRRYRDDYLVGRVRPEKAWEAMLSTQETCVCFETRAKRMHELHEPLKLWNQNEMYQHCPNIVPTRKGWNIRNIVRIIMVLAKAFASSMFFKNNWGVQGSFTTCCRLQVIENMFNS